MPRKYKKLKVCKSYTEGDLTQAVLDVIENHRSLRGAASHYHIPLGTLHNRIREKHQKRPGRPTVLSPAEEEKLVTLVNTCGDWGYPLTALDVRMFVQYIMKSAGTVKVKL